MRILRKEYLPHYTYDDYVEWEGRWELIDGIAYAMVPAPLRIHQALAYEIARLLGNQVEDCTKCEVLGEIDYKIAEDTILRPDVVLICGETNERFLTKPPEIIVEVISKSSVLWDEKYKFEIYEREKVKYYVLVYPEDLVAKVYKLDGKRYDKQGVFVIESYEFDEAICKVTLDFSEVFKRYRSDS